MSTTKGGAKNKVQEENAEMRGEFEDMEEAYSDNEGGHGSRNDN
jgi:hypothetical protein